ncbi:MAG: sulfur carrier protein ThiS [Pirellula sp.]|jgi:sulfur carrier protein|nr:sulfur carrier protein ThiS [Pirellula sp.]
MATGSLGVDHASMPVQGKFERSIDDLMLEIEFNGAKRQVPVGTTILDLLQESRIETRFCAVESNLDIVPKSHYGSHQVQSGDKIEVVTLVGGG